MHKCVVIPALFIIFPLGQQIELIIVILKESVIDKNYIKSEIIKLFNRN